MVDNTTEPDVLELDNELLLDGDEGGEEALQKERGVLLLTEMLDPEGPIINVALGPDFDPDEMPKPKKASRKFEIVRNKRPTKLKTHVDAVDKVASEPAQEVPDDTRIDVPVEAKAEVEAPKVEEEAKAKSDTKPASESPLARFVREARALAADYEAINARTRKALYKALGRAYDVAVAASHAPEEFAALLDEAGIVAQERAPMTPVVKLVFGADYDKTRLSEYAAVLAYARKQKVGLGELAGFIGKAEGGLKGVLQLARLGDASARSHEVKRTRPLPTLVHKLEELPCRHFGDLEAEGDEYTLVLARRLPDGQMGALGEVPRDIPMLEKAIRRLLAEAADAPKGD